MSFRQLSVNYRAYCVEKAILKPGITLDLTANVADDTAEPGAQEFEFSPGDVGQIVHVLEDQQSGHQPRRQWWLPRPDPTDRTEASGQKRPINLCVAWLAHGFLQQRICCQK